VKALLFLFALGGCDFAYQTLAGGDYGTVYVCDSGAMCEGGREEWCWDGDADELEQLLGPGVECHSIELGERAWPAIVGCAYDCDGSSFCDAHCGCACEAP
jgi:hypothetical protein